MPTSSNIIWISEKSKNEMSDYLKKLESSTLYNINQFHSIEDSINKIKEIRFEETIIIINENLYIQFIEQFQKNLKYIYIIPKIVIFCIKKEEFINKNKEYEKIINHPFYNSGGIKTNLEEINKFILNPICKKKILLNNYEDEQLVFEYIDSKEKLLLPMLYKTLLNITSADNINSFNQSLYNKYANKSSELDILLNSIKSISDIPIELLSKYYTRIYTDQDSHFYSDLNKDLRENKKSKYLSYIKVLYEGILKQSLPLSTDKILYRGSLLANKEINKLKKYLKDKIEGLPGAIIFSKSFLSFSKEKEVAQYFLNINENKNKDFLSKVLFTLEKEEDIDYSLSTHADIEALSYFDEKEVLFFPFSSFEIKEINEAIVNNEKIYEIKLLYLGKYVKEFRQNKEFIESENIIPNSEFRKQIVQIGLLNQDNINQNNNAKQLMTKYERYEENIIKNKNESDIKSIINNIERNEKNKNEQKNERLDVKQMIKNINKTIIKPNNNDVNKGIIKFNDNISNKTIIRSNNNDTNKEIIKSNNNISNKAEIRPNNNDIKQTVNKKKEEIMQNEINKKEESKNFIIAQTYVEDCSQDFLIINSFENSQRKYKAIEEEDTSQYENEKEIKENCSIEINNKKIPFAYYYKFNTPGIQTIKYIFKNNLTKIDYMFYECMLIHIDLSNFNSKNVTNMRSMFQGCNGLVSINFSNFNTQNVTNMSYLFEYCESLLSLDLSSFNTQNVIDMSNMFSENASLKNLDLSNFNTQKVSRMNFMFDCCTSLSHLNLSNFIVQNDTNLSGIFLGCKSLKSENIICKNEKILNELKESCY